MSKETAGSEMTPEAEANLNKMGLVAADMRANESAINSAASRMFASLIRQVQQEALSLSDGTGVDAHLISARLGYLIKEYAQDANNLLVGVARASGASSDVAVSAERAGNNPGFGISSEVRDAVEAAGRVAQETGSEITVSRNGRYGSYLYRVTVTPELMISDVSVGKAVRA